MKMLVTRTPASATEPFTLDEVKQHCRVDHSEDDEAIRTIAWTAAQELEQFAQIALLNQTIRVTIYDPFFERGLRLPIGPVADGIVPTVEVDGGDFTAFDFTGGNHPFIQWGSAFHALTPELLVIEYQAGFGEAATAIPNDLAQALMDQSALHYDGRSPMFSKSLTTSPHMARIGAKYRGVQL